MLKDVTFALRSLKRAAGLTTASVLVLGLGIGGTTAIYSVLDALVVHPLAIRQIDRVLSIWESLPATGFTHDEASGPNYLDWKSQSHSFSSLAALGFRPFNMTGNGRPLQFQGATVTTEYFDVLAARPLVGRTFNAADDQPGTRVVVMSARLWSRQFGGDSSVIGRAITLNGLPYTVVGVAPAGIQYPSTVDIWAPVASADLSRQGRNSHYLRVIGRLQPGVTEQAARSELAGIAARLVKDYPQTNTGRSVFVAKLRDDAARNVAPALFALGAAMLVLLLIACTNVANLLLTRAASRQNELALRSSLGATRWRLVSQLLTEALVLATGGGALGALIAAFGVRLAKALIPPEQGQYLVGYDTLHVDPMIIVAAALLSLVTAVGIGVLPAFHASRPRLAFGTRSTADQRSTRTRAVLVIAEVSLALLLLIGAGLMVKSYDRLIAVQPGFRTDHVLLADLALPSATYGDSTRVVQFWDNVVAKLRASPGVTAAGAASIVPLCGCNQTTSFLVVGAPAPTPGNVPETPYRTIVPGYFASLSIPMRRGRDFDGHDRRVVVVNEKFAARYFPGKDPLGEQVRFQSDTLPFRVVGVVGDVRHMGLDQDPQPELYVPLAANPANYMTLVVQTAGDPRAATKTLAAAVAAVDPDEAIARVITMEDAARLSNFLQTLALVLLLAFALVAALLAAIGIYGVISYSVGQRTREIGIRSALGASRAALLTLMVREGLVPVTIGLGIGLLVSVATTRVISGLLYAVSPTDAATFLFVSAGLGAIGLVAIYVPAQRAARIDPIVALRSE